MDAYIYKPAKTVMQSGHDEARGWVLEFSMPVKRASDPVMGWTAISGTGSQVRLYFDTREQAIAYAKREGLTFMVAKDNARARRLKSYAHNFSANRKQAWTH